MGVGRGACRELMGLAVKFVFSFCLGQGRQPLGERGTGTSAIGNACCGCFRILPHLNEAVLKANHVGILDSVHTALQDGECKDWPQVLFGGGFWRNRPRGNFLPSRLVFDCELLRARHTVHAVTFSRAGGCPATVGRSSDTPPTSCEPFLPQIVAGHSDILSCWEGPRCQRRSGGLRLVRGVFQCFAVFVNGMRVQ